MTTVPRILGTAAALELIARLRDRHGPLMFHQSGGACDGSSPKCYPRGELFVGDHGLLLGEVGDCPFYISAAQYETWRNTQLIIDVEPGRGGRFSLDSAEGVRFLTRSRFLREDELAALPPLAVTPPAGPP